MPKPIDLTKLSPQQIKNFIVNNNKAGQMEAVEAATKELEKRGLATKRDYQHLSWNQDKVAEVMQPFKKLAQTIKDSQRTTYTEAGGRKIGRSKDDPDWCWIDTYSAIN